MKFTPEVIAALATLYAAAENDFEHHRIKVLERDLTAPPQVEIIDETHQKFNGVTYKKNSQGHFANFFPIHRAVWIYCNGEIPEGDYEIHHVDKDKANNDIFNLQCLTRVEHHRIHMKTAPAREHICKNCGKVFTSTSTKGHVSCCSKDCLHALSYKQRHEIRTCALCGKKFSVYKYSHTKCCSASCAAKLLRSLPSNNMKTCPVCAKEFEAKVSNQIYCSNYCGQITRRSKRKFNK